MMATPRFLVVVGWTTFLEGSQLRSEGIGVARTRDRIIVRQSTDCEVSTKLYGQRQFHSTKRDHRHPAAAWLNTKLRLPTPVDRTTTRPRRPLFRSIPYDCSFLKNAPKQIPAQHLRITAACSCAAPSTQHPALSATVGFVLTALHFRLSCLAAAWFSGPRGVIPERHPAANRKQPRSVALLCEPTEAPKLFKALMQ